MNIQTQDNACMHQCGSLLMRIAVLLKLFNMLYAQLGPTMERIKDSILFYSFAVFRSYLFKEISCLHKIISTDKNVNGFIKYHLLC